MPFIRGRYHINPVAGQALEAAREVEEVVAALEQGGRDESDANSYEWAPGSATDETGPIHRVEIEAASLVPAHSGQAEHGFVARVHRASYAPAQGAGSSSSGSGHGGSSSTAGAPLDKPETHAFANEDDLVDFLQRELAKDAAKRQCAREARHA